MTMDDYEITDESIVKFHNLFRGEEHEFITVGRQDIGKYVSLPREALEVIDLLDSGRKVGDVKRILKDKYGEDVEIEEFIEDMITNEMVESINGFETVTTSKQQKDLFSGVTARHVGWMFSTYAWVAYVGMAVSCLVIFALVPDYIPNPRDYFFHPWYSVAVGFMFFLGWILVAIHELAHLFAAKSVGIEGNFSLSNRLVFIVAQTNLGNIWTVPRRKRYIVYFAGMAWDSVMVFGCLVLLLFSDHGIVTISMLSYKFLKALIFAKVWTIIWQFRFNMQTDVYYAIANYFRCRSLLGDAQIHIKNYLSRFFSRIKKVDMGDIPENEMRIIKWYALLYFVGTSVTLASYFLRNLPLILLQVVRAFDGLVAGYATNHADFTDAIVLIVLNSFRYGLLGFVILRPRWNRLKERFHAGAA
jgi:putative peptide zinc metalloprotease protein